MNINQYQKSYYKLNFHPDQIIGIIESHLNSNNSQLQKTKNDIIYTGKINEYEFELYRKLKNNFFY